MKKYTPLWIILLVLAVLVPLGLWLPERAGAGDAWGEWGAEDLSAKIGYAPSGMEQLAGLWSAPLPDYSVGEANPYLGYILSALIGVAVVGGATYGLSRLLVRRG